MILRKPYAVLIKYFKLINLVLAVLSIYVAYRTYNVITFFSDYVTNDYSGNFYKGFYNEYITAFFYIVIVVILIGSLVMGLLLLYKKKPTKVYLSSIIYYIILIICLSIFKNVMITLETSVINAETARIYRDVSLLSIVPQFYFILMFIIRGLGFNLRKFNFQEDLKELEISEQDSEEVEITFNKEGVKLQRNLRRFSREFNYYLRENKFIVVIISILVVLGFGFLIYVSLPEKVNQEYKQGEKFYIGELTYNIEDSIITKINYNGDLLNDYYVVAKLYIENSTSEEINIDINDFRLEVGDEYIYPAKDQGKNFIDYSEVYYGSSIKANSKKVYSLIYKISENNIKKKYNIKINSGSTSSNNLQVGKFSIISITPIIVEKVTTEKEVNQGDEISFTNSNLGNTTFMLTNAFITNKYTYNYEYCKNDKCNTYKDSISVDYTKNNKALMVFDYHFNLDNETSYANTSKEVGEFINNFMKIRYIENDEVKYSSVRNVTPSNLKDKLVIETSDKIEQIDNLYVSIIVRNKEYSIKIK